MTKPKTGQPAATPTSPTPQVDNPDAPQEHFAPEPSHDPFRRTTDLLQRLAPGRIRVGFFLGAGCPLAVRVPSGESTKPLIPDVAGLTVAVKSALDADADLKGLAGEIWNRVVGRGLVSPTIEDVLSHLRVLKSLAGPLGIDGFSESNLSQLDRTICEHVRSIVSLALPSSGTPYHSLASWIQAIAREKPVEIFTTNYDLLLEQALEEQRVPYFDGFVGTESAFLDLESMTEDDLPSRWARVWKIHGSVNWWMTKNRKIRRSRDKIEGEQLLIYPSHLKYDQSRQMPYYAMLDRLRVFLRTDQCVLLICGYSFADEHINAYLGQGLSGNPNASCIAMIFGDRSTVPRAVELARRHANLSVLAADGAVVGTVDRPWQSTVSSNHPAYPISVATTLLKGRTLAAPDQCKWLLGDFGSLGQFLAHQLSSRDVEREVHDAP